MNGRTTGFCLTVAMLFAAAGAAGADDLKGQFASPPDAARPWVYWFIMDGNLSREGITADLESMRAAGIGGVILMEVNVGIPRGPVEFMSDSWRDLFGHAVREAERLGLEITMNAGPGWTGSGGPWVKPEQSMQHLVASAVELTGPAKFDAPLPRPEPREPYFGSAGLPPEMIEARRNFYADEAVLAFPTPEAGARLADVDEKALYVRAPYTSRPGVKPYLPPPAPHDLPPGAAIALGDVVDLTDRLQDDGRLAWAVPAGKWTILRFGRRNTGANTRPAPQPGLGLECDKFDPRALEAHFDAFVGRLLQSVGKRSEDPSRGWTMLHIDSWEMGAQNWTAGFRDEFERRRGYDPLRYLPAMTGRIVESAEVSERFLWDLRQTAQELVVENHAEHLRQLGRRHGLGLSIEPYDMNPTSDLVLGAAADVPMCEFWSRGFGFDSAFSCIEAASIAHTNGRPIVAAEAFTASAKEAWTLYPAAMKDQGDWALCTGINRLVFHRFAHQPWLDRRPGMTMGPYGVHWDRTQTFWPMIGAYHTYLARCQFLLRQGSPVADICYLAPEGAPHVFRPPMSVLEGELGERRGYSFDGCAPAALLTEAVVKDGRIVFPGGAYRLLVLPRFETMTPALLSKIRELVEAGATVVGSPPQRSPSLSGYPQCDAQVRSLAAALWAAERSPAQATERRVGRGRILWGGELSPAPSREQAPPAIDKARWIWYLEGNPAAAAEPSTRYFRRVFTLDSKKPVRSARVQITADNEFQLFVNGRETAEGDNFHQIYTAEVTALLKPGENVFAAAVINGGDGPNPAGMIAACEVVYQDGTSLLIVSDREWQAAGEVQTGWQKPIAPAQGWTGAMDLGPADMGPWRLNTKSLVEFPELYPDYNATARVLSDAGVVPDFESAGPVRYTHRRTEALDIYFVANRTADRVEAECTFRVEGVRPELWDPLTGAIRDLPDFREGNGRVSVPLRFEAHQSFFVVFERGRSKGETPVANEGNFPETTPIARLEGPWDVSFDPSLGGPDHVRFESLEGWSRRSEPGIKYYSGIAKYEKRFDLPEEPAGATRIVLDLGVVHSLARVRLNGRDLGVVWCAPWQVDMTAAAAKDNRLEIEVANLWPNRLIGDQRLPPEQRVSWSTWNPYRADSPLQPSGLLGPVTLSRRVNNGTR